MCALSARALCLLVVCVAASGVWAEPRTTPVTVENSPTVKVEPTANTVKIDASANAVKAAQSGTWNVGITGTPSVSISNSPTVSIASGNSVETTAHSAKVQLWTSDQAIPAGGHLSSTYLDTSGYRELRFALGGNAGSVTTLTASVYFRNGSGTYVSLGYANYGGGAVGVSDEANFQPAAGTCVFTVPVMSEECFVRITNNTGGSVTIPSWSWVYMVN